MGREKPKDIDEEVTHVFLMKHTEKGLAQTPAEKKKAQEDVTEAVLKEGAQCRLFLTRGAAYDYVSIMTGLSAAAAMRIVAEIEKNGTVRATLLAGAEVFNKA